MKGKWIPNLVGRILDRSITVAEAVGFVAWRLGPRHSPLKIERLRFRQVDRTTWGLIANIFLGREYTPPGFEISSDDVVIDIGAHQGVFVGFAGRRTTSSITAIEPDPDNFQCLEQFVSENRLQNVVLRRIAIDTVSGQTALFRAASSSRHTITGLDQVTGERFTNSLRVEALSLADLLEGFASVDFLKMDCEGAELGILMDAEDKVLRKIRRLVAEVHWIGREEIFQPFMARLTRTYDGVKFVRTSRNLGVVYCWQPTRPGSRADA